MKSSLSLLCRFALVSLGCCVLTSVAWGQEIMNANPDYLQFRQKMMQDLAFVGERIVSLEQKIVEQPPEKKTKNQNALHQLRQLRNTLTQKLDALTQASPDEYENSKKVIEHNYNRLCYQLDKISN